MSYSGMGTTSLLQLIAQTYRAPAPRVVATMTPLTTRSTQAQAQAASPQLGGTVRDLCAKVGYLRDWASSYARAGGPRPWPTALRAGDGTALTQEQVLALLNHQDLVAMCRAGVDPSTVLTGDGLETHAYVDALFRQWRDAQTLPISITPGEPLPTTQVPSSTFTPQWGKYLPYAAVAAGLIGIGYMIARKR